MKMIKFFTPFLFTFPVWMVIAGMTWLGRFESYNLSPAQGMLFIAIGFTMVIFDLFLKYLIGKEKVLYVWIIEVIIFVILAVMILPRFKAEIYI